MNDEILNIIGNKKMTFDEIEVYFSDSSSLKEALDNLVDKNILSFEDNKYFKNYDLMSKEAIIYYLKNAAFDNVNHLSKHFKIKPEKLDEILKELVNDNILYTKKNESKNFYYIYTGTILFNRSNDWIVDDETNTRYEILNAKNLYNGDKCKFVRYFYDARIIEVTERKYNNLVGMIKFVDKRDKKTNERYQAIRFVPKVKDINFNLTLTPEMLNGAIDKDVVILDITYDDKTIVPVGVSKIITRYDDNYLDILTKIYEYGFTVDFDEKTQAEASNIESSVAPSELKGRVDYRKLNIITIDNDDSKDFDDAVSVEVLPNGNYKLGVYIADVTHYVKEGSPLDKEALKRGTSLYLADIVVPMLPFELSNGICSLNPNVDRLVLACIMEIDSKGEVVNYEINEGVIKSRHQMVYSKVNKIYDGDKALIKEYNDIYDMLLKMRDLSDIIRLRREKKGALDFEAPEFNFKMVDGKPVEIYKCVRGRAEKMIEDFMLIANETIAYNANIMGLPIVYRIHEAPDQDKLTQTLKAIYSMGYKTKKTKNGIHVKELQTLLNNLREDANYEIVSDMILRSMMKAKYSESNLGHYGLQLDNYCHFTSPIRRYPDLETHRVIKSVMLHPKGNEYKHFSSLIPDIALRNSLSERKSVDLERKVNDILYAKYYEDKINETVVGKIKTITKFGMFIRLDDGMEGLLSFYNMPTYVYVNESFTEATDENGTYKIGDKIKVKIISADTTEGLIEFGIERKKRNHENHMSK